MFLLLFHSFVIALNTFAIWYDLKYVDIPALIEIQKNLPLKGRLIFFTIWAIILQTIYFSLALLNDIVGTNAPDPRKTSAIRVVRDSIFSVAFPVAIYVTSSFWTIYAIDRELIYPAVTDKSIPTWLNHTLHTLIAVFILLELILTNRNYPSRKIGATMAITYILSYLVWLHILHARTGLWVYPFLAVLNLTQRIVFFIVAGTFGFGIYFLGEKVNSLISVNRSKSHEY